MSALFLKGLQPVCAQIKSQTASPANGQSHFGLTVAVGADLWPGALIGLSRSLRGLPEDPRVSGPGGHTTAAQVEASLSQTDKAMEHGEEKENSY